MSTRSNSRVVLSRISRSRNRKRPGIKDHKLLDVTHQNKKTPRIKQLPKIPSLKDFLHKQNVVNQYRSFARAAALISDNHWKQHVLKEIRETFQSNRNETDKLAISMAFKEVSYSSSQVEACTPLS